jgi:MerR family transcriptional regulator, light-induced transcriptional regulator
MASLRLFAETGTDWHGCRRDSLDIAGVNIGQRLAREKVANGSRKLLARTIEAEIIPRLIVAHRSPGPADASRELEAGQPSADDIVHFVGLLLSHDVTVASAYIESTCQRGASLECVFLDLMAPAARYLGELWQQDLCDFTDVTIALSRMQQLLRELSPAFEAETEPAASTRSALLVAAPGDQHTFGVFIVQEFFRRAGWQVRGGYVGSTDELLDIVSGDAFDLVGLSVSNEIEPEYFATLICCVREAALRRATRVMVGGRFFLDHPEYVARVGADATAKDGRRAVLRLSSLLRTNALR